MVLNTANPEEKCAAALSAAESWNSGKFKQIGSPKSILKPKRPPLPNILPANQMPKRRALTTVAGQVALFHALAHIELNAIDLAWDLIARFACKKLPKEFFDDWVRVGGEEARHFLLLNQLLLDHDASYGCLAAHGGLWQAAIVTKDNLAARLAVVPMVLEARGLDVTPKIVNKLFHVGHKKAAQCLNEILSEEIDHVAIGEHWFRWVSKDQETKPEVSWAQILADYFPGKLKPPFNIEARKRAGMAAYLTYVEHQILKSR